MDNLGKSSQEQFKDHFADKQTEAEMAGEGVLTGLTLNQGKAIAEEGMILSALKLNGLTILDKALLTGQVMPDGSITYLYKGQKILTINKIKAKLVAGENNNYTLKAELTCETYKAELHSNDP